ncbi:MAG: hypothetical protein KAU20_05500 [Nanoarchaeota archaeon]|nr:hypothetical protein [Nanoarchaeota archaeon]
MVSSEDSSKKRFPRNFSSKKGVFDLYGEMGEDFMGDLRGVGGLRIYRKMRWNDPVIGGLLMRMESIFSSVKWTYDGEEILSIDIIRNIIREFTSVFTYGFYVGEIIYSLKNGKVVINDIEPRGQMTIDEIDEKGISQINGNKPIPTDKCFYLTIMSEVRWKFGRSLLRHVYKPYYYKKSIEAAEAVGADRDLAGLPVLTAPEGFDFTSGQEGNSNYSELVKTTLEWAADVVSNIRSDEQEGVVLPFDWNLTLLRGEKGGTDTDKILRRYNTEICVGLLESFVAEGAFGSSTRGASEVGYSMFLNSCEGWVRFFVDNINKQVIERVCEYNGVKNVPVLKYTPVNAENIKDLASYVARLVNQEVISVTPELENSLLRIAKLPEREEGGK